MANQELVNAIKAQDAAVANFREIEKLLGMPDVEMMQENITFMLAQGKNPATLYEAAIAEWKETTGELIEVAKRANTDEVPAAKSLVRTMTFSLQEDLPGYQKRLAKIHALMPTGSALLAPEPERHVVLIINPALKRQIAEKVVEQAHPAYSYPYQGQWYTDGERLYHAQDNRPYDPWGEAQVISVDDLVFEHGGAEGCSFAVEVEEGISEEEAAEAALDFAVAYIPDKVEIDG